MNTAERKFMRKVYDCINRMSGMSPSNPAYLKAKAKSNELQCRCRSALTMALSCLNRGDLDDPRLRADEAKSILGLQ
jgi:hypothetical protein